MKTVNRQAIVPFTNEQMFKLVDDIDLYPEFLPYCGGSEVLLRSDHHVEAQLAVIKGSFQQKFTTRNTNSEYDSIKMELIDGPFKYLNGVWTFTALNESASKIELLIEFEFSNKLVGLAFGKVFNQLTESFVDAFSERARAVYLT